MDSTSSEPPGRSILVENDAELRALIAFAFGQADYEVVLASFGEDALNLIVAADFDGPRCDIEFLGQVDGREVGITFFTRPSKPTVYASAATTEPPGTPRNGIFLRNRREAAGSSTEPKH